MKPMLDKVVGAIIQRLEEQPDKAPSETGLRRWLKGQGFPQNDIDAALKLLESEIVCIERKARPTAVRILMPWETFKLSTEARDALVRLELHELISPEEREMILERMMEFDGEVGMEEFSHLVSWLVCSVRDVESQRTIFEVMDGLGEALH